MKIAVMGAGGIGAYLGALLAKSGQDVTLICRGAHLAAIRGNGLRVKTSSGEFTVEDIRATDDPATVGAVDVILQCTKLYDLAATSRQMLPMVGPRTMVVPVQNGVTAADEIGAIVGTEHVVGGSVFLSSFVVAPGVIERKSEVDVLVFGELDGRISERVAAFRDVGVAAGYMARVSDNIQRELWAKFVMLGGTAAICVLSRQPVGVIRDDERLRALLIQGMQEVVAVAKAKGIELDADVIDRAMVFTYKAKADAKVSMLEDLEAGKPLELEWLHGHLTREARRLGVPVPIHDIAYACARPYAEGNRRRETI